jgi:hypothetical protein
MASVSPSFSSSSRPCPIEGVDLAIPDFDDQAAQAATTTLSVPAHTLGRRFPDRGETRH